MSIRQSALAVLVFGMSAIACRCANAQVPSTINHYQFLPRASVLVETRGDATAGIVFHVRGDFEFKIEQSPLAIFPPVFFAKFIDPEVTAFHPVIDRVIDVDKLLNFEGLTGGQKLTYPRRPNVFTFRGDGSNGSKVELHAILDGPWFYLRGGTIPPAEQLEPMKYHIRAIARRTPVADVNDDGVVDRSDLAALVVEHSADGSALPRVAAPTWRTSADS